MKIKSSLVCPPPPQDRLVSNIGSGNFLWSADLVGLARDKGDLNVPTEFWKQKHLYLLIQGAADGTRQALLAASSLLTEEQDGGKRNCVVGGKSAPEPDTRCHVFAATDSITG